MSFPRGPAHERRSRRLVRGAGPRSRRSETAQGHAPARPAESAALASLHDGDPETYLAHKAKDITLHGTGADALRTAVERWAELRDTHGPSGGYG